MGRDAGWTEHPSHHSERARWFSSRGLSRRGYDAVVHRRDRWLQRVDKGNTDRTGIIFFLLFFLLMKLR